MSLSHSIQEQKCLSTCLSFLFCFVFSFICFTEPSLSQSQVIGVGKVEPNMTEGKELALDPGSVFQSKCWVQKWLYDLI